jgi:hypothetical protein
MNTTEKARVRLGPIDWLTERLGKLVQAATDTVVAARSRASEWKATMQSLLTRYHVASYMAATGKTELLPGDIETLKASITDQLKFLEGFADEIAAGELTPAEIAARAQIYAGGPRTSFWMGVAGDMPLPAQPGQDTECQSNCRCSWSITDLGEGNFDAYWELGGAKQHCGTCLWRASNWSPVQIRSGRLQE